MALLPTAADYLIDVTTSLVTVPQVSDTLGVPVILTNDTLDGGGAGTYLPFSTSDAVAEALAASKIGSTTAANLNVGLAQTNRPSSLYVVTYGSGAPSDALELAIGAGLEVAVFYLQSNAEADHETLAVWLTGDPQRRAQYRMIVQSADTSLYGGSKPASLSDCEIPECRVIYSADADAAAASALSTTCGRSLSGAVDPTGSFGVNSSGPLAAKFTPINVSPASVTRSQCDALLANDVSVIRPADVGADAAIRVMLGEKAYDGSDWKSSISLCYTARELRRRLMAFWIAKMQAADPVPADDRGRAMAEAQVQEVLAVISAAGHYTPRPNAPNGYRISSRVATVNDNAVIIVDVLLSFAREVATISVPVTGEVF